MFIVYFELDPSTDPAAIIDVFQKIQEANIEAEKWDVKCWYVSFIFLNQV